MRKIISLFTIGMLLVSCNDKTTDKGDGYVLNGTAKGIYNGMRVYLSAADERGGQIPKDTAVVMDETFKFEGKTENPQMWFLSVNNVPGYVPVMIENETITINFIKEDIDGSTVSGTKANEALSRYTKGFKILKAEQAEAHKQFSSTLNPSNAELREEKSKALTDIKAKMANYPFEFLKQQEGTFFTLSLIDNLLKSNTTRFDEVEKVYNGLDSELKNSVLGKSVGENIASIKKRNDGLAMLNIGSEAPDFSAPDPKGKQVSMHDIRGKATIIDFWASWCGPCRRENPNVVKVYEKYHDKGLEIISVSLDKPGDQEKWLKAIEDDKLTWHHVSNLKYFQDPIAQQYNIQAIPATYILDAEGKIVAKSLRGQALEDKIAEMLN